MENLQRKYKHRVKREYNPFAMEVLDETYIGPGKIECKHK